jgi:uncharacterized protein YndB with AHSA1/START domain
MSIAPIRIQVTVDAPPERAFALFGQSMGKWWPKGKTIGATPHADIVIEPSVGGRWYERGEDGTECDWGTVLAWEPPTRLLLGWHLDATWKFDPRLTTTVEITFTLASAGGTVVTLEHRDLERFGPSAEQVSDRIRHGWPILVNAYGEYARGVTAQ